MKKKEQTENKNKIAHLYPTTLIIALNINAQLKEICRLNKNTWLNHILSERNFEYNNIDRF